MNSPTPRAYLSEKTHAKVTGRGTALRRYQDVVVGHHSLAKTLYFDFCTWLSPVPGALGLALRKLFWPRLFASCGRGVQFASHITLRHPHRIRLGDRVVLSERCILDARSPEISEAIVLGDDVMIANDAMFQTKGGRITVGDRVGIGPSCLFIASQRSFIEIGSDVAIGPRCTIVGGGTYHTDSFEMPMWRQARIDGTGVRLGNDIWLGANVSVLTGVTIADGCVAAAGAVVTRDVPERVLIAGVPARVIKKRGAADAGQWAGGMNNSDIGQPTHSGLAQQNA